MLKLGEYNTLEIVRERDQGIYLSDDDGNEVLLPNKYVPDEFMIRDELKVFLYLDHEERIVATTIEPFATVHTFAYLKCTTVSDIGAFIDWGLEKELFIPFKEQASKMRVNSWYLVYVYLDKETNRLVGSSKTNAFLDNSLVLLSSYDEVTRPDGKIDLTLQRHGYRAIEPNAQQILDELKSSGGFIDLNDKSDPNDIKEVFQLSKKSFKKAIGSLYKAKQISIEKDGIRLVE